MKIGGKPLCQTSSYTANTLPQAIETLVKGLAEGSWASDFTWGYRLRQDFRDGSVIKGLRFLPLMISHNKTLAEELIGEVGEFFPENAVEYSWN